MTFWRGVSGDGNGDTRSMAAWCWLSAQAGGDFVVPLLGCGDDRLGGSQEPLEQFRLFYRYAGLLPDSFRSAGEAGRPQALAEVCRGGGAWTWPRRSASCTPRVARLSLRARGGSSVGDRSSPPAARREPCSGELDQPLAVGRQSARSTVGGSARPGIAHLPRAHPSRYSRGRYMRSPRHANWPGDIPRRLRWFL